MWGCGRNGLWGQMRSLMVDAFEALRGRGGLRSHGFEENGFARRPPPGIVLPPRPSAARTAVAAAATPAASEPAAEAATPAAADDPSSAEAGAAATTATAAARPPPEPGATGGGGSSAGPAPPAYTRASGYRCGAAVGPQQGPAGSRHRFELLGMDFMVRGCPNRRPREKAG